MVYRSEYLHIKYNTMTSYIYPPMPKLFLSFDIVGSFVQVILSDGVFNLDKDDDCYNKESEYHLSKVIIEVGGFEHDPLTDTRIKGLAF